MLIFSNINDFLKRRFPLAESLLDRLIGLRHRRKLIYSAQSALQKIRVIDRGDLRSLLLGEGNTPIQTCISSKKPQEHILKCTRLMMASLYLNPHPQKMLIIGLGGGVLARSLAQLFPQADITSVEMDPLVVQVAQTYFDFNVSAKQHIVIEDGRKFIERALQQGQHYDLIMLDAFDAFYIPTNLMTLEFLQAVKSLLTTEGVLAANTFSLSTLYDRESVTYAAVFGQFYSLKFKNRIILAQKNGLASLQSVQQAARELESQLKHLGIERQWLTKLFTIEPDWDQQALPLRDVPGSDRAEPD